MKKCPYCAEEIQDEAIKCRYCHSVLNKITPKQKRATKIEEDGSVYTKRRFLENSKKNKKAEPQNHDTRRQLNEWAASVVAILMIIGILYVFLEVVYQILYVITYGI